MDMISLQVFSVSTSKVLLHLLVRGLDLVLDGDIVFRGDDLLVPPGEGLEVSPFLGDKTRCLFGIAGGKCGMAFVKMGRIHAFPPRFCSLAVSGRIRTTTRVWVFTFRGDWVLLVVVEEDKGDWGPAFS